MSSRYGSALTILNLWRDLRENVHGKFLSDAVKERGIPTLELILVAGTSPQITMVIIALP